MRDTRLAERRRCRIRTRHSAPAAAHAGGDGCCRSSTIRASLSTVVRTARDAWRAREVRAFTRHGVVVRVYRENAVRYSGGQQAGRTDRLNRAYVCVDAGAPDRYSGLGSVVAGALYTPTRDDVASEPLYSVCFVGGIVGSLDETPVRRPSQGGSGTAARGSFCYPSFGGELPMPDAENNEAPRQRLLVRAGF